MLVKGATGQFQKIENTDDLDYVTVWNFLLKFVSGEKHWRYIHHKKHSMKVGFVVTHTMICVHTHIDNMMDTNFVYGKTAMFSRHTQKCCDLMTIVAERITIKFSCDENSFVKCVLW